MQKNLHSMGAALLAAALAITARAEEVVFEFAGVVEAIDGTLPAPFTGVQVGDPYTLTYTFESTTPDLEIKDPNSGAYPAVLTYTLNVNGAEQSGSPFPLNYIITNVEMQRYGAFLADLFVDLTMVAIVDFEPGTLADDSLPSSLQFDRRIATDFQFGGSNGFADCSITGYRRIGGVDCDAIRKFKVVCRNAKVKAKVVSDLPEGTELTLDNNGEQQAVIIGSNGKAKAVWTGQSGVHVVFIVECPDRLQTTDCG